MEYTDLINEVEKEGIEVVEMNFKGKSKGYYLGNTVAINSKIKTTAEKKCTLIEEVGHAKTSSGNILDNRDVRNIKQEKRARRWGYEKLVGIVDLINAFNAGLHGRYEIAQYLNVTENFLQKSVDYYKEKYGIYFEIDTYIVCFEPSLTIFKKY